MIKIEITVSDEEGYMQESEAKSFERAKILLTSMETHYKNEMDNIIKQLVAERD